MLNKIMAVGMSVLILVFTACAPHSGHVREGSGPQRYHQGNDNRDSARSGDPLVDASEELITRSRGHSLAGELNSAIRALERAINLNPGYGPSYFYLAEAWLKKGNTAQSLEFHRHAKIYLNDNEEWSERLKDQFERILNDER